MAEKTTKKTDKTDSTTQGEFVSLTDASDAFKTKSNGIQFHAQLRSTLNMDSTINPAGEQYAVRSLVNISGSTELINNRLGVKFEEDKTYHNISAQLTWFVKTEKEAIQVQAEMAKGAYFTGPVTVGTHEYNGNTYLQLQVYTPYLRPSGEGNGNLGTPAVKSSPAKSQVDTSEMSDDDLPF